MDEEPFEQGTKQLPFDEQGAAIMGRAPGSYLT